MEDLATLQRFRLRELDEIFDLAQKLAEQFASQDVMTGIYELLLNAVEHGNLGIGFAAKSKLLREGVWHEEVQRRMRLPENAEKEVHIAVTQTPAQVRLIIADEGEGFDWKYHLSQCMRRERPHGRGLLVAMHAGFDSLSFNPKGSAVTCTLAKNGT